MTLPRDKLVHPAQVLILVSIEKVLELCVKDLQMLLDENSFTRLLKSLQRRFVKIDLQKRNSFVDKIIFHFSIKRPSLILL